QQFLRDETFERPEGLLLEHRANGWFLARFAFAKNQLAHFLEQRRRRVRELSLQGVCPHEAGQRRQLTGGKPQKLFHLVVNIGALGRWWRLFPRQQLRNVRLRHLGGRSQIPLLGSQFFEAVSDEERKIHGALPPAG